MQFDEILDTVGGFGRFQKWVLFLICVLVACTAAIYMNPVFLLGTPAHRCALPGLPNDTYEIQNQQHRALIEATIPMLDDDPKAYDQCYIYMFMNDTIIDRMVGASGHNSSLKTNKTTKVQCNTWVYDRSIYYETFVTKMNLVCDKKILAANAGMVFYLGMLLGSLVGGVLSDRFGRKTTQVAAITVMSCASLANAWSNSYAMFVALQIVKGGASIIHYLCGYVLAMEVTGREKRGLLGTMIPQAYVAGIIVFTGISYFLRHWFWNQLVMALPGFLFISYWWILPESPRWLLTRNRTDEAETIIREIARWNKVNLCQESLKTELVTKEDISEKNAGILALFSTKTMRLRSVLICFQWLVMAFVFYGLSLNSVNLSGNLYLNFALLALVETPGYATVTLLGDRIGRKRLYFISVLIAGLAFLATIVATQFAPDIAGLTIFLSLVGKLCTSCGFGVIYVFSTELFPTVARNAGMGCASMSARIGSMLAPYLVVFGKTVGGTFGKSLPFILFGGLSILSACLVLLLPETLNRNMTETIPQGEKAKKRTANLI